MHLRDAIHDLTPEARWAELLKFTHGNLFDAINALSGRWIGKMALTHEIASKNLYAERERGMFRACQRLCRQVIADFDSLRRDGKILLKGFTIASPTRSISIPLDMQLKYDFAANSAQCGDLKFYKVTVTKEAAAAQNRDHIVAGAALEAFCTRFIGEHPIPSMKALHEAANLEFKGKHVSRARIRQLHKKLIPATLRTRGPRKPRAN